MVPAPLVGHTTGAIDEIKPIGHAAVGVADTVVEVIDEQGHRHFQCGAAFVGQVGTLEERLGLRESDAIAIVRSHAPPVGRVGFADIDADELDLVAIDLFQIFDGPKLGPVGASGKAPKNEDDGLLIAETR